MFRKGRKLVGPLALAALLFASAPAAAAGPRSASDILAWAWDWLQALWAEKAPVPLWEEAGPCVDPNGRPCAGTTEDPGQPEPSTDDGWHIDPDG